MQPKSFSSIAESIIALALRKSAVGATRRSTSVRLHPLRSWLGRKQLLASGAEDSAPLMLCRREAAHNRAAIFKGSRMPWRTGSKAEGTGLCKPQVVRVRRSAPAHEAGFIGHFARTVGSASSSMGIAGAIKSGSAYKRP